MTKEGEDRRRRRKRKVLIKRSEGCKMRRK
jgi:hypothetical protein